MIYFALGLKSVLFGWTEHTLQTWYGDLGG